MASRFKKCILHIGTEKTGTTTLQAFLSENRATLLKQGFFVPRSLSPYPLLANHERLTTYSLRDSKIRDDLRIAAGVNSTEQVEPHRADVLAKFRAELVGSDLPNMTLLLSNEHCHSRLLEPDEVGRLHALLSEFVDDFQIVIYIRPQHELATSLYDQALKAGYFDIDIIPFTDPKKKQWVTRRYFQYDEIVKRWADVFGQKSMTVRLFQRQHLRQQNIILDFLDLLGVASGQMKLVQDHNRSIGRSLQQALNVINRFGAAHLGAIPPQTRARLIELFGDANPEPGVKPMRQAAMDFFNSFASGNEFVRQTYFPNQSSLFQVDFSSYPSDAAPEAPDSDVLAKAVLHLAKS